MDKWLREHHTEKATKQDLMVSDEKHAAIRSALLSSHLRGELTELGLETTLRLAVFVGRAGHSRSRVHWLQER